MASFKVRLYDIVLSVTVCTVGYVCLIRRVQIFVDFVSYLSMIIYEVLYSLLWCLRYNICSAWFLDIRISTCFRVFYCQFHLPSRLNKPHIMHAYHLYIQACIRSPLYQSWLLNSLPCNKHLVNLVLLYSSFACHKSGLHLFTNYLLTVLQPRVTTIINSCYNYV